ncbi:MAG: ABC transporter ATP-binding protein [Clostridia bacterium]|nr:ABC transporter ATP-binding protein [Clostridia bacterium]
MALLKLKNIGKIYDSNDILTIGIRGVDLEFDYNEFVIIEGESGSGKSTLLNVIGANDSYEEGELYFDGLETSHYSEAEWERYRDKNIATIFQDFNIIENLTVQENVELALLRYDDGRERKRIARELIEKVGLTKQANQKGSKLSGGEKQRTVIARALAKDSPVILADEPTGNLDVKSSKEVAKLLKDVSKDKLVIVVTHNPEYFKQYASRRIRIYDGHVSEDRVIEKPAPRADVEIKQIPQKKNHDFLTTMWIGRLNYKSRPKFAVMMTCAMFVCAITLFLILSVFGGALIKPYTETIDKTAVEGKVIVSAASGTITERELDFLASETNAGYVLLNREKAEFEVTVAKKRGMLSSYKVTCLYAPYIYDPSKGNAVLVMPISASRDAEVIKNAFIGADVGIESVTVEKKLSASDIRLYLSSEDIVENGDKIKAINSNMKLGETDWTIYTFRKDPELENGKIDLINSNSYEAEKYLAVFSIKDDKTYSVASSNEFDDGVDGIVVEFSESDYDELFGRKESEANQSCLYFSDTKAAESAIEKIPEGYIGMLSTGRVYLYNAGDVFTMDIVYYIALIAISILLAALISVIFGRTVKIYSADFAVYRTLGISSKISSRSLYAQMLFIFLPTLLLLPLVSLIATVFPGSGLTFITFGNYAFIELMMLLIVEAVAFGFNKSISGKSIRKTLKRGSK